MDEEVGERTRKDVLFDIIEKEEGGKFISLLRNRDLFLNFENKDVEYYHDSFWEGYRKWDLLKEKKVAKHVDQVQGWIS